MTLGMICRADDGGLGSQTWEAFRHLHPAKTLVVHTAHKARGRAHEDRYPSSPQCAVRFTHEGPSARDVDWLIDGPTVLFSVETFYAGRLLNAATEKQIRTVLLANPEMHDRRLAADEVFVPTRWRADLVPDAQLLPAPVDRVRLPFRARNEARTLYHVASPAFHDRNGTDLVVAAAAKMNEPCRLLIRGGGRRPGRGERIGRVEVTWLGHHDGAYHEAWPADVDLLVLPRRFGGLSLPMQEAASLGIPIVTLDVAPQDEWLPPSARVAATVDRTVPVKGGTIDIWTCAPAALAERLDHFVRSPDLVAEHSTLASQWADSLSWDRLRPRYEELLGVRVDHRPLPAGDPRT